MPDVELVATKDFSYATRRLKAGDTFHVAAPMARVLVGIGKAEEPRQPGKVAPPPASVVAAAETATPAKVEAPAKAEANPVPAMTSRSTTRKRRTTRKSAAKKG